jgi:preprotein translocase subunit YajC
LNQEEENMDWVYAMGTGPGGAGSGGAGPGGGMMGALLPLLLMFLVFYILLIRPQQKRTKEHREFLSALKKGDEVMTSGGIYGKVTGITENVVTLEVADKVRIKVQRSNIAGTRPKPAADKGS